MRTRHRPPWPPTPFGIHLSDPRPRPDAEESAPRWQKINWHPWQMAGAVALVAALVTIAAVYSNAQGAQDIAARGTLGVHAEATMSTAAATRNRTAQAQVIAAAAELGSATANQLEETRRAAGTALVMVGERVGTLTSLMAEGSAAIEVRAADFESSVQAALALLDSGAIEEARAAIENTMEPAYRSLIDELTALRDEQIEEMAIVEAGAGRVADAARFLVAFLVPFTAILAYRGFASRRQRRLDLEHELQQQRAVGKAKDEFIANISHELRTPLTAIYGFAITLIEDETLDDGIRMEMTKLVAGEAAELSRMVDDLLTVANAEQSGLAYKFEDVDPAYEVNEVLAPIHAQGIDVSTDLAPGIVRADSLRLRQVIRNLVSNSIKHGGTDIRVMGLISGSDYRLTVSDDGPGVPTELEDKLFDRFVHQGSEPLLTGSVGLGLSVAHLITAEMGGTITYDRSDGRTSFTVSLPGQPATERDAPGQRQSLALN